MFDTLSGQIQFDEFSDPDHGTISTGTSGLDLDPKSCNVVGSLAFGTKA